MQVAFTFYSSVHEYTVKGLLTRLNVAQRFVEKERRVKSAEYKNVIYDPLLFVYGKMC